MGYDGTGKIYIPLEEFWSFVQRYSPGDGNAEIRYGKDIEMGDSELVINYAFSTDCPPEQWENPPDFVKKES